MNFNQAFDPFRSLKPSWTALFSAPVPLFIGGLLLVFTSGGGGGAGFNPQGDPHEWFETPQAFWAVFGVLAMFLCCFGVAMFLFSSWIEIGFNRAVEQTLRTGASDVGTVFESTSQYLPMLGARFLAGLANVFAALPMLVLIGVPLLLAESGRVAQGPALVLGIVAVLMYLPVYIYVVLGLVLVKQAVALDSLSALDALRKSWSLAAGHRLALFWFLLVTSVVGFAGVCACCVGVFVTGPWTLVARVEAYLAYTRGDERSNWWIETRVTPVKPVETWGSMPPPPSAPPPVQTANTPPPLVPPPPHIPPPPPPPAPPLA